MLAEWTLLLVAPSSALMAMATQRIDERMLERADNGFVFMDFICSVPLLTLLGG
jgi:hypothetical protein